MTIENAELREDLRAWLKSTAIGLPEYSADLTVQRRVGRMLATSPLGPDAQRKSVANPIQICLPDQP